MCSCRKNKAMAKASSNVNKSNAGKPRVTRVVRRGTTSRVISNLAAKNKQKQLNNHNKTIRNIVN